jgi:hypothetical protein
MRSGCNPAQSGLKKIVAIRKETDYISARLRFKECPAARFLPFDALCGSVDVCG